MDERTQQIQECLAFIKSKGPFPQGELVLVAGNFNFDANLVSPDKDGSLIQAMLKDPVTYPAINARRVEVKDEYHNMFITLKGNVDFNVSNISVMKTNIFQPTLGICTLVEEIW